ncbi:hypothetical protein KC19_6G055700 [Ceratodon purpureus]|uniref:Uncharacterized protein n=1 Tax=Ceratodon purpureus TaxID=3225 RepID=A0A8T0HAU0_CERPU|nr:hypothetical protein KC19_6G055700 [Ceratodon purpureus]
MSLRGSMFVELGCMQGSIAKQPQWNSAGSYYDQEPPNLVNLSRNAFSGSALLSFGFNGTLNTTTSVVDLSHNQLTAALDSWSRSQLGTLQEL